MPNLKAEIKYIDLGVAIGALLDMASDYADLDECKEKTVKMCARELEKLPAIDPESLRPTGEWVQSGQCNHKPCRIRNADHWTTYKCSECGHSNGRRFNDNYCPNCGAKMKEAT